MKRLFTYVTAATLLVAMLLSACHKQKNHPLDEELVNRLEEQKELLNTEDSPITLDYRVEVDTLILTVDFKKEVDGMMAFMADSNNVQGYVFERLLEMDIIPLVYKNGITTGMELTLKGDKPFARFVIPFEDLDIIKEMLTGAIEEVPFGEGEEMELPFTEEDFADVDWKTSIKMIDDSVFGPVPLVIDEIQTLSRLETNGNEHLLYFDVKSDQLPSEEALEEMLMPAYKSQISRQYGVIADKLCKAKVNFHIVLHSTLLDQDIANFTVSADELFH
ncbi:MAG: hypothetical protein MJZ96_00495 [Paludibacteraceae bacterium]|nr:hypothetical protein [Paludibacteraceae bacterium]